MKKPPTPQRLSRRPGAASAPTGEFVAARHGDPPFGARSVRAVTPVTWFLYAASLDPRRPALGPVAAPRGRATRGAQPPRRPADPTGLGAILLAAALLAAAAAAEPPEMATDRPDQTESSSLVTPGRFQVEVGWTHAVTDARGAVATSDAGPETLVRIGWLPWAELRLIHAGWNRVAAPDRPVATGMGDAAAGLKFGLARERGALPETALNVHVSLPIGDEAFSSGKPDPSFRFLCSHTLSDRFALAYNLGAAWATEETAPNTQSALSVLEYTGSVSADLGSGAGAYVEVFGNAGLSRPGKPATLVNGGLTVRLRPNFQLDAAGGVGLSESADDWFAGAGASVRFPD
jgi:hypothetical protein